MSSINLKYPEVDLLKLASQFSFNDWFLFLTSCIRLQDVEKLKATRYGLQVSMSNLAKKKLNDSKVNNLFLKLQHELELSMKKILKTKYPLPGDNHFDIQGKTPESYAVKKNRDGNFEKFLKESSY